MLALTRQSLPTLRDDAEKNLCAAGAYEITAGGDAAQVTLMASGSEVSVAFAARALLEQDGIATRIISVPCMELFARQSPERQADILGDTPVRIAIEAAIRMSWDRWLRDGDGFIGMEQFGASAPAERLFAHFGITGEDVAQAARALLKG